MHKKIAFLHTVPSLVAVFNKLSRQILPPGVEVFHIADEMLLKIVLSQGGLSPFIHRRVAEHAFAAEIAGANLLQVTCSSLSPCVDSTTPLVGIPVLKIDEPMIEQALQLGATIGVCATAPTTLKPTTDLVYQKAASAGRNVKVEPLLSEGAYTALSSGDQETHDRLVRGSILTLASYTDVVILAQASMARVLDLIIPSELQVPVLSSPKFALERVLEILTRSEE